MSKRKRAASYSPTVSRMCAAFPASVTHRAYTRCRSTVLKRARVHDAPRTMPFDQELALQAAVAKLRAQIDMEQRALYTFLHSAPLVGHQNAARVHQLRKNEHMLRTRRIKSLEARLEEFMKQIAVEPVFEPIVVNVVEKAVEPVVEAVVKVVEPVVKAVEAVVKAVEPVVEAVVKVVEPVVEAVVKVVEPAVKAVEPVVEAVVEAVEPVVEAVVKVVEPVVEAVVKVVKPVVEAVVKVVEPVVEKHVENVVKAVPMMAQQDMALELKMKKMETRIKEMEDALRLAGDASEAAKLVLKLRAQLKRANVEEIEWDFMADGAYEAAMSAAANAACPPWQSTPRSPRG